MDLYSHIREARKARGWSMAELARRAHISKGYLSTIEARQADPSFSTLCKIAHAFGQEVGDFLVCASYTTRNEPAERGWAG